MTKQAKIKELYEESEALRHKVFDVRDPEDDELRRVQGLLSEVRDLLLAATEKAARSEQCPHFSRAPHPVEVCGLSRGHDGACEPKVFAGTKPEDRAAVKDLPAVATNRSRAQKYALDVAEGLAQVLSLEELTELQDLLEHAGMRLEMRAEETPSQLPDTARVLHRRAERIAELIIALEPFTDPD